MDGVGTASHLKDEQIGSAFAVYRIVAAFAIKYVVLTSSIDGVISVSAIDRVRTVVSVRVSDRRIKVIVAVSQISRIVT